MDRQLSFGLVIVVELIAGTVCSIMASATFVVPVFEFKLKPIPAVFVAKLAASIIGA